MGTVQGKLSQIEHFVFANEQEGELTVLTSGILHVYDIYIFILTFE